MTSMLRFPSVCLLLALTACPSDSASDGGESSTAAESSSGSSTSVTTTADTSSSSSADTTMGDAVCGNDMIEGDEVCDGSDLGDNTCADVNPNFTGGTLACAADCTFDTAGCEMGPGTAIVTINEITSTPLTMGPYTGAPDAIELYNAGTGVGMLSGWRITDDAAFAADSTYTFPAGATIEPGEYLVLVGIGINGMGELPFGISDDSEETIVLDDGTGGVVDSITFQGVDARVSWCRVPDGDGDFGFCEQTYGETNVSAATACGNGVLEAGEACDGEDLGGESCESLGLGFSGGTLACTATCIPDVTACTTDSQVVINELESTGDDIELFNAGEADVDISGWVLTDDAVDGSYDPRVDREELVFAAGTVIGAGEYLVVPVGALANQHPFGLSGGGDQLTLFSLAPIVVRDAVAYGDGDAAVSYCRLPNGPGGTWTADCAATMGAENSN